MPCFEATLSHSFMSFLRGVYKIQDKFDPSNAFTDKESLQNDVTTFAIMKYSQTCVQRPPLRPKICGRC